MSNANKIYCIDSSPLIFAMKSAYPIEIFPPFWEKLSELIREKRIISSQAVLEEIEVMDDDLYEWAQQQDGLFLPIDASVAEQLPIVMSKCPTLIDPTKKKDEADPYIVALAKVRGAVLVTQENANGEKHPRMKIPDACKVMGIRCTNLLGLMRELSWKFPA